MIGMRPILRTGLTVAILALLAASCAGGGGEGEDDDRVRVVASFYPLAEAAARVGGEHVEVVNLTPPGVEPHDLELTADDLEAIAGADVILYLGSGFQPAVEDAVTNEATGVALDVLAGQELLPAPADDHGHDEEGEDPDEHEAEEGVVGDPHVWLDPVRFAAVSAAIGDTLAEADPANAEDYRARASGFSEELAALDEEYRAGLAACDGRVLFVNHAAFGYLAAAYDLEQEAISVSPEAEPDPARLAELRDEAIADGVTTIFTESLVSPDVAETLAAEVGVATAVLNPLEGLTPEQEAAGDDYLSVMRENLETLRGGLGCA
jgi:zinc transport system substrate-binding protein